MDQPIQDQQVGHFDNRGHCIVVDEQADDGTDMLPAWGLAGVQRRAHYYAAALFWARAMADAGDRRRFRDFPSRRLME